ncbi:MAG: selenocysteine-specific translation elongation factor [Acidobacteriia bacterium]|nr:selenocysteine-specific translation elongation factor [Terriglobia bacterium]
MKYVIVGTAGHIDHGKSALVKALTGTDPDRWEEEKRRGITLDLGFAPLGLADDLRAGFVDVPGHERFVRNMLAGVGGIDLVLLVIAADESIKPQTREHFDICRLLELRKGIVVLTKSDLVEKEILDLVRMEIQEFVAGSFLEGAPIVAVSARTGEGLDTLRTELLRLGREVAPKPVASLFRLPIDRAFVMKGFGAVVTGTLISGQIRKEEEVEVFPLGRRVRVRGIQVHNQDTERAVAGQRTALNLAGIEARELARGMTLAPPGLFQSSTRLEVAVSLLASARPLKNRSRAHFHSWTSEMVVEVVLLGAKELRPGERAYAQLRLAEPGLFLPGDHFIIRQFSPLVTLGGGVVLDNDPPAHRADDESAREFLLTMETGQPAARLERLAERAGEISLPSLVARTGWQPEDVLNFAKRLETEKRGRLLGQPANLFVHAGYFERLAKRVLEQLENFHAANPLVSGLTKEDLRGRLARHVSGQVVLPSAVLFNAVLQSLAAEGKVLLEGETVRRAGREIQLSPQEAAAKEQISRAFEKAGLAVPTAGEVLGGLSLDRARAEKILRILLKEKVLVKVTEDLIFHRSALERLRELVARRKQQSNRLNVAVFKELTGLTRKYAIPLLEYLDRERVTRREGDERVIL